MSNQLLGPQGINQCLLRYVALFLKLLLLRDGATRARWLAIEGATGGLRHPLFFDSDQMAIMTKCGIDQSTNVRVERDPL